MRLLRVMVGDHQNQNCHYNEFWSHLVNSFRKVLSLTFLGIVSMNPWCVLRIIFMIPLCSRINFSNLAGSDQQHLDFYLSADFWHQRVNQLIQDKGSTALCFWESARFLDWQFPPYSSTGISTGWTSFFKTYSWENKTPIDDITCIFQSGIKKNLQHKPSTKG